MLREFLIEWDAMLQKASMTGRYQDFLQALETFRLQVAGLSVDVDEILREFKWLIESSDYSIGGLLISVAFAHPSSTFVEPLCELLELHDPKMLNEDIVELLGELNDQRAIPILVKALSYRFPDDTNLSLPVKALHSLNQIGGDTAMRVLQDTTKAPEEILRFTANEILGLPNFDETE